MVKKKAKAKKAKKPSVPGRKANELLKSGQGIPMQSAAIVAHVLSYFAGGYLAERQTDSGAPVPPQRTTIYKTLGAFNAFHALLLDSTIRNFHKLNWDTNQPLREQVFDAAFEHGLRCRRRVVTDGTGTLTLKQILYELAGVQAAICPGGIGGGPVCDF